MSALSQLALTLCYLSVAVTVISLFIPQKRTRKIFSFVIGLFVLCSLMDIVANAMDVIDTDGIDISDAVVETSDPQDYNDAVIQMTADNLVSATDEILRAEGIEARDIQIRLKISDSGRIYVDDVVIYINENDLLRKQETESIIYRNLSKEPRIYVAKEEVE